MRSLYARIFVTCCGTMLLALCGFLAVSVGVGQERSIKNFAQVFNLEHSLGERIYQEEGREALRAFLASLDEQFTSRHFIVDRNGRDLVTGEDRSAWLAPDKRRKRSVLTSVRRFLLDTENMIVKHSPTSEYSIIVFARPWAEARAQFPYYIGILLCVSVLNALVGIRIVSALREIARAAESFGQGDLEMRAKSAARRDEVGLVASAFNRMAERVRELILSERRLLADVSHELRSPLARLSFAAELARTTTDREGAAGIVQAQIRTLTSLVSSLLQTTRVTSTPGQTSEDVAPADVVDEVVATNALNAQQKQCRVAVTVGTTRPVRGERAMLARALDNVVRNAIEYSPLGGQIDVDVHEAADRVIVSVRDRGPGVPDDMLGRIFDPFFRVDESRQAETGGVGLGLAIVKRVVQSHGGTVQAGNVSPGLEVVLSLPVAQSDREQPRHAA